MSDMNRTKPEPAAKSPAAIRPRSLWLLGLGLLLPLAVSVAYGASRHSAHGREVMRTAEQQLAGRTALQAAIDAGRTRIRPVLMTAAAMIVGMIPMAIGAAGEEQMQAWGEMVEEQGNAIMDSRCLDHLIIIQHE